MPPFETTLAFIMVFSLAFVLPFTAIISRKNSPIGQALADRIRRRRRLAVDEVPAPKQLEHRNQLLIQLERQQELLQEQQIEIKQLQDRIDFLDRLVDRREDTVE